MIRIQCETCLSTTLSAAHDPSHILSPHSQLQKSTSNLTTGSYSMIGSADFGSVEGRSTESSGVLVGRTGNDESKRAWDWRIGLGKESTGEDVVRILRLGIAREVGRAFAEGET